MLEPCLLCVATCPLPAGEHPSTALIKGKTFAPFAPDFRVFRSPEEICSVEAVLKSFLESPSPIQMTPTRNLKENLDCVVSEHMGGVRNHGLAIPGLDQAHALAI